MRYDFMNLNYNFMKLLGEAWPDNSSTCLFCVQTDNACVASFRGNHLSNTTCLTQAFFKSGEGRGTSRCSLTL